MVTVVIMVVTGGFEPPTSAFVERRSDPLSYVTLEDGIGIEPNVGTLKESCKSQSALNLPSMEDSGRFELPAGGLRGHCNNHAALRSLSTILRCLVQPSSYRGLR